MLLPIKWLKDYVDIDVSIRELSDRLTDSGSHVEAINDLEVDVEKVVVGRIEKIEEHPNADKLVKTKINIGEDELVDIVTGAKNIEEGDYVPVALVGAVLADGMEIKPTDFRGEMSYGMLCSLEEIGYKESVIPKQYRDGIYILGEEELGKDIREVLELEGQVMELEITPNRPDCLSVIGMARETAATFDKKLKKPEIKIKNEVDNIDDYIEEVKIDENLCKRYYGKVIKDVVIKDSPQWLQNRLMEAGVRPINNIVDITNYVMLEYGQPLHAFDLDKLSGKTIEVRKAKENEIITTLDDVERKLREEDLVIADDSKPIAIAGVMGGLNSEVSEETRTIFLESANFDSRSVRLTAKYLNLRTDASARFEKWIDIKLAEEAALRACQLIEETGSGLVVKGEVDQGSYELKENIIDLKASKVNNLLGISLSLEEIESYLNRLEFETSNKGEYLQVKVPTYRLDVSRDVDLVEEVGRLYSFGKIELKPLSGEISQGGRSYERKVERKISDTLLGLGISKVMSYSFISPKSYDKINISENSELRNYVKLLNPLGEDYSVMRTTLISNMLELLSKNSNHGVGECLYFEIGNIFIPMDPKGSTVKTLPEQRKVLNIGMYGEVDFYYLKEALNVMFEKIDISEIRYEVEENNSTFHPTRTANILLRDKKIGIIGEIHPDVLDNYRLKERVYLAEIEMEELYKEANLNKKFKELPKYPAISRDLAFVVDESVLVGDIEDIVWSNNDSGLIESFELFDVYSGSQIEKGRKSIAFSVVYRSEEGTLKDQEVDAVENKIIKDIEGKLEGELRA